MAFIFLRWETTSFVFIHLLFQHGRPLLSQQHWQASFFFFQRHLECLFTMCKIIFNKLIVLIPEYQDISKAKKYFMVDKVVSEMENCKNISVSHYTSKHPIQLQASKLHNENNLKKNHLKLKVCLIRLSPFSLYNSSKRTS